MALRRHGSRKQFNRAWNEAAAVIGLPGRQSGVTAAHNPIFDMDEAAPIP
jgi:hypothetical protein